MLWFGEKNNMLLPFKPEVNKQLNYSIFFRQINVYKPDFQDPQFKDVTGVGEAPPPGKAFRRSFKSSAVNKLWIFMEDVSFPIIFLLNSCIFSEKRIDLYNFYYFIFCQIQNREIFWQLWWLTDRKCSNAQVRWPWKFEITYLFLINGLII